MPTTRGTALPFARSPFRLPALERHHVGPLAVTVRPVVDRPFLAAAEFAQHGGGVRPAAVDEEAAGHRSLDLVVAKQLELVENQKQACIVAAGVDAVHLTGTAAAHPIRPCDALRRPRVRPDATVEP